MSTSCGLSRCDLACKKEISRLSVDQKNTFPFNNVIPFRRLHIGQGEAQFARRHRRLFSDNCTTVVAVTDMTSRLPLYMDPIADRCSSLTSNSLNNAAVLKQAMYRWMFSHVPASAMWYSKGCRVIIFFLVPPCFPYLQAIGITLSIAGLASCLPKSSSGSMTTKLRSL